MSNRLNSAISSKKDKKTCFIYRAGFFGDILLEVFGLSAKVCVLFL